MIYVSQITKKAQKQLLEKDTEKKEFKTLINFIKNSIKSVSDEQRENDNLFSFFFYYFINKNFYIGFKTSTKNSEFSFKQVIILFDLLMHKLVTLVIMLCKTYEKLCDSLFTRFTVPKLAFKEIKH